MKVLFRIVVTIVALAAGIAPAAALAHAHGNSQNAPGHNKSTSTTSTSTTTPTPRSQAEKQCREERATLGKSTFDQTYGTNHNGANAFGKCVSHRTHQDQASNGSATTSAEKTCRSEQNDSSFGSSHNGESFDQFYGTGKNGKNAFGKCVSSHAKSSSQQQESGEVQAEENAARQCRAQETSDRTAFEDKYGTNDNKSNAFGKCVSETAHQNEQQSSSGSGSSGS